MSPSGLDVVVDGDVLGRQRTGDETYVRSLLEELGRRDEGLRIGAVARDASLVPAGIEARALPVRSQAARLGWQLPRLLAGLSPRLTHFQYVIPPAWRGPSVVTVHDLSYELLPELEDRFDGWALRRLVPRSVRRAERVFTVSEWTKDDLVRRYRLEPDRVVVTPNGVGPEFSPEGPRPDRRPYLLFVGALRPRKDPLTALRALGLLGGDLDLVMVGPDRGLGPAVRAFVAGEGLADRVEVLGHVTQGELVELYRGAECLVLPTRFEGFGLPVVEAMASGTPVVSTRVGAVPEVAGEAAVLVEPGSPGALAEGIGAALADSDRLVAAGLVRAKEYSWAGMAGRTAKAYRDVL